MRILAQITWKKITPLVVILVGCFLFSLEAKAEGDANVSLPPERPLPVIELVAEEKLYPVVEAASAALRAEEAMDVHVSYMETVDIISRILKEGRIADIVFIEGKEALAVGAKQGTLNPDSALAIASDRLVAVIGELVANKDPIRMLRKAKPGRVALPDAKRTPEGVHAEAALKRLSMLKKVQKRATYYPDGKRATEAVARNEADIALAYFSDVEQTDGVKRALALPNHTYFQIIYYAVPLSGEATKIQQKGAEILMHFIASSACRDFWMENGFHPALAETGKPER